MVEHNLMKTDGYLFNVTPPKNVHTNSKDFKMKTKRARQVNVMVTDFELGKFQTLADSAHMTLSGYIRFVLMRISEYPQVREVVNGSTVGQMLLTPPKP